MRAILSLKIEVVQHVQAMVRLPVKIDISQVKVLECTGIYPHSLHHLHEVGEVRIVKPDNQTISHGGSSVDSKLEIELFRFISDLDNRALSSRRGAVIDEEGHAQNPLIRISGDLRQQ